MCKESEDMFNLFKKFNGNSISASDAKKRIEEGKHVVLLDVRTPEEYKSSRINGSVLVPLDSLSTKISKVVSDKDVEIIVYCRSGARAKSAMGLLSKMGYTNVKNLGGIISWPYGTISSN